MFNRSTWVLFLRPLAFTRPEDGVSQNASGQWEVSIA